MGLHHTDAQHHKTDKLVHLKVDKTYQTSDINVKPMQA
jgi:hypothetical protein